MLKAGKPTTLKSQKELAIEAVKELDVPEEATTETAKAKTKRFNVDIPEELHRAVKLQATHEGVTLNELAVRLLNEYLSKVLNE